MGHPEPVATTEPIDLAALFEQHAAWLCRVVHRLTGNAELAEEIVQEVFVTAHRRRAEIDPRQNPKGWLYRVAVNHARHHRRGRGRLGAFLDRWRARPVREESAPEEIAGQRERARRIQAITLQLPEAQREVFVLYELEELDGREIAELLDVPLNTVWSRLRLARARFKELWLAAHGGTP